MRPLPLVAAGRAVAARTSAARATAAHVVARGAAARAATVASLAAAAVSPLAAPLAAQDAVPRELAAALVDAGQPVRPDSLALTVGRPPEGFVAAAALPAGARVLGGVRWPSGAALTVAAVDGTPATVRAGTLAALEQAGWRVPPASPNGDLAYPRFVSSTSADPEGDAVRCAPGGGAVLVGTRARDGGAPGTLLRLLALAPARAWQCRPQPALPAYAEPTAPPPLGPLRPPPGVRIGPDATQSSDGAFTATVRATGDSADPAALRAYYAAQIRAAGWAPAAVAGWDTARATPLLVSPADSAGARWAAVVTAVRDSARGVALTLQLSRIAPGRGRGGDGAFGVAMPDASALGASSTSVGWREGPGAASGGRGARPARGGPAGRDRAAPVPRELVDALFQLSPFGADASTGTRSPLTVGRAPAGWTAPLPSAPGTRLLGGTNYGIWDDEGSVEGMAVLAAAAPGTPSAAQAAYLRQLDAAGWRPGRPGPNEADLGLRGFLPSGAAPSDAGPKAGVRCAPHRDAALTVAADPRAAGGTLLRLMAVGGEAAAWTCAAPDTVSEQGRLRAPMFGAASAPFPALTVPPGLTVSNGSGGGGGSRWEASATVRGAASARAVLEAYAPQLRAAGWTVGAPAAGDEVAAVRITRAPRRTTAADSAGWEDGPDAGAWTGVLAAAARGDGAYAVTLWAVRARRSAP